MADDPLLSSLNDDTLRNAQAIGDSMVEAGDAARRLNTELRASSQLMVDYATTYSKIKTSANAVAQIQDKAKVSARAVNDATREQAKNLTSVRELNAKIEDLYRRARRETGTVKDQLLAQAKNLSEGRDNAQALADLYGGIAKDASSINSKTAFFNAMSAFVKDIPGLRVLSKPFEDAAKASRETVLQNAKILQNKEAIGKFTEAELRTGRGLTKERLRQLGLSEITGDTAGQAAGKLLKQYRDTTKQSSILGAGMKSFAKSAASSAMSFFKTGGYIGLIVAGAKKLVNLFIEADNRVAQVAGALNMSKVEAANFGLEILRASGGIDYFTERLRAGLELAASFARQTGIIATNVEVFNTTLDVLNRRFSLSEQQTAELAKNMIISGQSAREFAVSALGAAEALEMQNGVNISNEAIMRDIADLTATQYLNLEGQPDAIARAVTQARRFGMTMSLIEGTQSSLLNFGQSITDELNAELLLGRELNLDRARLAALDNNYAAVAAEISSQIGKAANFSKMNYFQQVALAKAVGMTREELAKTLKEQEALEKAGFASAEAREKKFRALIDSGLTQQQALQRIGMAEYTRQKNSLSVQEQLNILLDNMKVLFLDTINPLLQEGLGYLMEHKYIINDVVEFLKNAAIATVDFVKEIINARKEGKSFTDILKDGMGEVGNTVYRVGLVLDALLIKPIKAAVDLLQGSFKFIQAGGNILSGNFLEGIRLGKEGLSELKDGLANTLDAGTNLIVGISGEGQANFFNKLAKGEINIDGTSTDLAKTASQEVKEGYTEVDGILYPSSAVNGVTTTPLVDETGASIFSPKKEEQTNSTSTTKPFTERSASIEHTNWLLSRLIEVVERGGDVYLDGRKVGEALVLNNTRQ